MKPADHAHSDWIVPDWPAPRQVGALCTTRAGGASAAPYGSLNLGSHVGDAAGAVQANRERLGRSLGGRAVFLDQVHGADVVQIGPESLDGIQADAAVARAPGLACTVLVADCLPVLFARRDGSAVGAAHAGWRGLAGGVLEATVQSLAPDGGAGLLAWLGPCIGPAAFEVGDDVRDAFIAGDPVARTAFTALPQAGKWLCDLPRLARLRLARAGLRSLHGNDGSAGWCTVGNAQRFHSFRRDQRALGGSGRLAACVWLR
ncbi:peptidoglycan editing factor PgeF [Xylophilus sp.]|uniref:peptidoglycan editing factor PgeF n=1 Tax=Xylophilus sp. TaxID=2653893 RepID=UPI0013B7E887|nr:peptidoglycan editing factor PgeF [Xylophilus sp.]KAF1043353.1 MAG: Polyphenol oxidase [Xylophilus sp.]